MKLRFYKYQGTGNDFVLLDNREAKLSLTTKQIVHICDRRFGVGADGLMLLQLKDGYDFEMIYYNNNGEPSTMCGNGGRCITAFAKKLGIIDMKTTFLAIDGVHESIIEDTYVQLKMKDVSEINMDEENFVLDTGSPHYVSKTTSLESKNVSAEGKTIRMSKAYADEGINVNFVQKVSENHIAVRTYERGVEAETLSCGTGVTACALIEMLGKQGDQTMAISTIGGTLRVKAENKDDTFSNIWLCGPAIYVFEGTINLADA